MFAIKENRSVRPSDNRLVWNVHCERIEKRKFKSHGRDWKPEKVVLRLLEKVSSEMRRNLITWFSNSRELNVSSKE
jgi:hypothetical protein